MTSTSAAPLASTLPRGLAAGMAGTAVMSAFQKLVEMPLTGRPDSYAPANFADKLTAGRAGRLGGRRRSNWVTHFALGGMWGAAFAVAESRGVRGPRAVAIVFTTVYTADVLLNTALGLYAPASWSRRDWAVDVVDKLVQAVGTGAAMRRLAP